MRCHITLEQIQQEQKTTWHRKNIYICNQICEGKETKLDLLSCVRSKIRQSTIWYAGSLGRWDKRLVKKASDVPSIIFS